MYPDFPVHECLPHVLCFKMVSQAIGIKLQSQLHFFLLGFGQELCRAWVGRDSPECREANNDSQNSFDNEDPSPAWLTTLSVHLIDRAGEKTSESSCKSGSREEDSGAESTFASTIP